MDFELAQEHKQLQQSVKNLVEQAILPTIMGYEEKSVFPLEIFRKIGQAGFLKTHIPKKYGGSGLGTIAFCLVCEELGKAGAGMVHNGHFQTQKMLTEYGTETQKEKYLDKLLNGEYLAATAITEPTVGSSFKNMQTRVKRQGDGYVLNGVKTLINDAAEADIMNVFARGEEGISVFLVEKETPGLRMLKKMDPIGLRSSPVYEFELKDCKVDADHLIGNIGYGFQTFFSAFNFSRLGNASAALGIAQAAFEKTVTYLKEREVGGRMAAEFQGLRWLLAELSTQLEAARLTRNRAAVMEEQKQDISLASSQTKLLCVQVAERVVSDCIQATGRYGCLRDNLFNLYLRDVKALGIAGGSLEIMKNNIARHLVGGR
jgi:alkylation response protein AidB-like acyl-CoA dehydrogenase